MNQSFSFEPPRDPAKTPGDGSQVDGNSSAIRTWLNYFPSNELMPLPIQSLDIQGIPSQSQLLNDLAFYENWSAFSDVLNNELTSATKLKELGDALNSPLRLLAAADSLTLAQRLAFKAPLEVFELALRAGLDLEACQDLKLSDGRELKGARLVFSALLGANSALVTKFLNSSRDGDEVLLYKVGQELVDKFSQCYNLDEAGNLVASNLSEFARALGCIEKFKEIFGDKIGYLFAAPISSYRISINHRVSILEYAVVNGAEASVIHQLMKLGAPFRPLEIDDVARGNTAVGYSQAELSSDRTKAIIRAIPFSPEPTKSDFSFAELLFQISNLSSKIIQETNYDQWKLIACRFLLFKHDPWHLYLFQKAIWTELEEFHPTKRHSNALQQLLPILVTDYPAGAATPIMEFIERSMDYNKRLHGYHRHEHAMAMLLNHGRDVLSLQHLSPITRAITSPYRFINFGMHRVGPVRLSNWTNLGWLAYNFLALKFDTKRDKNGDSLFSEFGFKEKDVARYSGNEGKELTFSGNTFYIEPDKLPKQRKEELGADYQLWSDSWIVLSQSAIAISARPFGTLIFSNGSPVIGASKLSHLAYYSSAFIGENRGFLGSELSFDELIQLERGDLISFATTENNYGFLARVFDPFNRQFRHILDPKFNKRSGELLDQNLSELIKRYKAFLDSYQGWIFETRRDKAFTWPFGDNQPPLLSGAHLSPGFSKLVDRLSRFKRDGMEVPDLAIAKRYFPPWSPYQFNHPRSRELRRLRVDDKTLELLERLVDGAISNREWIEGGLHSFFNMATKTQGCLVMLSRG